MLIAGYSGQSNLSNDGMELEGYDPAIGYHTEFACTNMIGRLISYSQRNAISHLSMAITKRVIYLKNPIDCTITSTIWHTNNRRCKHGI